MNCEILVKQLCVERTLTLFMPDARTLIFDRVHRAGASGLNETRPVVAKFHYYQDRETVRQKSYDYAEDL